MSVRNEGPFPRLRLRDLEGTVRPLEEAWSRGDALLLIGHEECSTTRLALPFVDRIHRRRASGEGVVAILQDEAESARALRDDLGLDLPIRLEEDPYPLAAALGVEVVPTLFLVAPGGRITRVSEGFCRDELEALAGRLGAGPLFTPEDEVPALRPG